MTILCYYGAVTDRPTGEIPPPFAFTDTWPGVTAMRLGEMFRPSGCTLTPLAPTLSKVCASTARVSVVMHAKIP